MIQIPEFGEILHSGIRYPCLPKVEVGEFLQPDKFPNARICSGMKRLMANTPPPGPNDPTQQRRGRVSYELQ